jgi:hypothetical protein
VKFAIGVHDRSFIGANGVRAAFERGFQMIDGGLAGTAVERSRLEEDVRVRSFKPFADILRRGPRGRLRAAARQECLGVESIRIRDPADAARGDASELPLDAVVLAQASFLRAQQTQEFLADVAEADQREFVRSNVSPSIVELVAREGGAAREAGGAA